MESSPVPPRESLLEYTILLQSLNKLNIVIPQCKQTSIADIS
jgi:hypothetical protein